MLQIRTSNRKNYRLTIKDYKHYCYGTLLEREHNYRIRHTIIVVTNPEK